MPSEPNIGTREREILTAIVETFISTGEPVGSRTLARNNRESLSAASIRNVMADLRRLNSPGINYHCCLGPDGKTFI